MATIFTEGDESILTTSYRGPGDVPSGVHRAGVPGSPGYNFLIRGFVAVRPLSKDTANYSFILFLGGSLRAIMGTMDSQNS
jgi:hypothetical protein